MRSVLAPRADLAWHAGASFDALYGGGYDNGGGAHDDGGADDDAGGPCAVCVACNSA